MSRDLRQYWGIRLAIIGGFFVSLGLAWTMTIRQYLALFDRTTDCGCAIGPLQWSTGMIIGTTLLAVATGYLTIRFMIEVIIRVRRHQALRRNVTADSRAVWHQRVGAMVLITDDSSAQAMTLGLLQPQMVVTTGLIDRLSGSELTSVLRHEQAHARARDPLWSLLLESIGATLSWLGDLRQAVNIAFSLREMIADAVATDNYTAPRQLSGAMYKIATDAQPTSVPAFSPNADRVTKLLNTAWELPVRWWSWRTITMTMMLAVGFWLANGLPRATAAAQPTLPSAACWLRQIMCAQPIEHILLMTPDASMSLYGR